MLTVCQQALLQAVSLKPVSLIFAVTDLGTGATGAPPPLRRHTTDKAQDKTSE